MVVKKTYFVCLLCVLSIFMPCLMSAQSDMKHPGLKTVVIDPGHGGKDPGAMGKTRKTDEKHIVLAVSKKFGEKIKSSYPDVKVIYTRSTDVFVELKERANVAKRNNADLFISIHCNSNGNPKAFGASAHILGSRSDNPKNKSDYFAKSMSVAQRENSVMLLEDDYKTTYQDFNPDSPESVIGHSLMWQANYNNSLLLASEYDALIHKPPYRVSNYTGIHQDVFYLLWATNMPAALMEIGFISNDADYKLMASPEGQDKIAGSLFEAFSSYKTKFDASVGVVVTPPRKSQNITTSPSQTAQSNMNQGHPKQSVQTQPVQKEVALSKSDSYFGIQIMGLGRVLRKGDPALKGLDVKIVKAAGSNIYKYVYGNFNSKSEAVSQLSAVRKKFSGAFVVKVTGDHVELVK